MKDAGTGRRAVALLLLGLALTLVALPGCARQAAPAISNAPVTPMSSKERTILLPRGLPPQVPVPAATVLKASGTDGANGTGVWAYTVDVASSPQMVVDWYTRTLAELNWDAVPPAASSDPSVVEREYRKGDGAQVRIRVTGQAGGGSRVEASVSIGMPVTPAQ